MSLADDIGTAVKLLIPPPLDAPPEKQLRWRWVIFFFLLGGNMCTAIHILLAWGIVTSFFPGFASAAEVAQQAKRIDLIAKIEIQRDLRTKTAERCNTHDQNFRNELNVEIDRLQDQYHELTNLWYRVPNCSDL